MQGGAGRDVEIVVDFILLELPWLQSRRILDEGITSRATLNSDGFNDTDIDRIISLINKNAFKRRMPDICVLGRKQIPVSIKLSE